MRQGSSRRAERLLVLAVTLFFLIGGAIVLALPARSPAPASEPDAQTTVPDSPDAQAPSEPVPLPEPDDEPAPDPREESYARGAAALDSGDYPAAYDALAAAAGYADADALRDSIPALARAEVLASAQKGGYDRSLELLRFLERIDDASAADTRTVLAAQEHIEPDRSWYENAQGTRLEQFGADVSAEAWSDCFRWMFLSGTTALQLSPDPDDPLSPDGSQALIGCALEGYERAEEDLCEYGAIYEEARVSVLDNGSAVTRVRLAVNYGNPYSDEELKSHVDALHDWCAGTLASLNGELRIGASMTRAQKARVLYDYVCTLLDYDASHAIHDPYVALQSRSGVCESYVSLYNCLCAMAGIPSRAQVGGVSGSDETHIWSVQTDEEGRLRYTDCTWGDHLGSTDYCWSDTLWSTHRPHRPA